MISIRLPSIDNLKELSDIDKFNFRINGIPNREIGFFDESLTGYIIYKESEPIRRSTAYLEVSILPADLVDDDVALGNYLSSAQEDGYEPTSFNILETTLTEADIVIEGVSDNDGNFYVVWRFEVPVSYPKRKLVNPKLVVSCIVHDHDTNVGVEAELKYDVPELPELVLPDYVPGHSPNLLSGLGQVSEFKRVVEVSEHEPSNTSPVPEIITKSPPIKASISIPVSVSLVIKLKSTKAAGRNNILLATLNIESSEELNRLLETDENRHNYLFNILSLSMDFKSGVIKELNTESYKYPLIFKSNDSINLTYKLLNNEYLDKELKNIENTQHSKPIGITLVLQVQKHVPGLDKPINPGSGLIPRPNTRKSAMMNSLYKIKSPNANASPLMPSISITNPISQKKIKSLGTSSSSVTVNLSSNSTLAGLKLTFQGKMNLKLGEILSWNVQAINNSMNRLNLSLIVQNPLNFNPSPSSTTTQKNNSLSNMLNTATENNNDIIIYTKPQLYSSYNSLKLNTNGIIILNNDIRIGPLDSNTVFETDIKLIGLSKGIFNLDGIKIFDINSGDGLDFGKLVEVFVI